jgi:hypothetical protein
MSMSLGEKGQGIVEFLLVFILIALAVWIAWMLLGPAISQWIRNFLNSA